jgi:glycopeptide antibiotics resistance protein
MDRILPGVLALLVAGVLAIALLVPFVAISYRRRGGLTPSRTLAWLALLVWMLAVQAYTLLPVPDGPYTCVGLEWDPLQAFRDVFAAGGIRGDAVQQLALNVLLFVPWGVLVRMLWRRGIVVATLSGLAISLLIETTQLTGVWGAFPCAYRLFDTGDLVTNTAGAALGSLAALPFLRHRETALPHHIREITLSRRLLGMLCDVLAALCTTAFAGIAANAVQLYLLRVEPGGLDPGLSSATGAAVSLLASGGVVLVTGSTIGEAAVRLEGVDGRSPAVLWRAVRFLVGIGGFQLLLLVPAASGLLTLAFTLATIAAAWRSERHRGLALIASGMRLRLRGAHDG